MMGRAAMLGVAGCVALATTTTSGASAFTQAGGGGIVSSAASSSGGFLDPVEHAWVSQPFGCTPLVFEPRDPSCPAGHFHSGIDLAAAAGTPVAATLGGVVHIAVMPAGYGLYIVVDHGGGLSSLYGHLSATFAQTGSDVAAGAVIGAVGSSGNSTGPHLHFEIRRDGIPEDPRTDLPLP